MKSPTLVGGCSILALALAGGCGRGQQPGTLGNPSAKAMLKKLAQALEDYDSSLSAAVPREAEVGEDPASIRGGMRTRVSLLQQMTANQGDVQEVLKSMAESLNAVEELSQSRTPDVTQIRQELEKTKAHVDSLRKKL